MNKIIMTAVLVFLSIVMGQAQSGAGKDVATTTPVVTKGYYSIYKNAGKLNHSNPLVSVTATQNPTAATLPEKGYYSMNNHHRKIYKSGVSFIAKSPKRPVASKGYYNMNTQSYEVVKDNHPKKDVLLSNTDSLYAVAE